MSKELIKSSQFARIKQKIYEDEDFVMTDSERAELTALYSGVANNYKRGKIIIGKIVKADSDGVIVDINYKSLGTIPTYEFSEHELKKISPGQDIEIILDELETADGSLSLSYEKAKALKAWTAITKLFEEGKPVEGTVTHKVKGGLSVDIGIPAFLPGSQVDLQRVNDFDAFVGQTITAHIIKINQKRGNVIISRRKYLSDIRSESRKKALESLVEGQVIQGVVKNITNYGAFVDIGGVDGLLHITDMTWGRIAHPSELLRIGDKLTVKVLSFDRVNEKISLGMKQLADNPWDALPANIVPGARLTGRISSINDHRFFFVELAKGIEGMVHISEISWTDRISDLHKHFKVGDTIEVYVVSVDKEARRISLSIKQLQKSPWEEVSQQFSVGQRIKGKISNITDFGLFVQLVPGIDGLVRISDISWTEHIAHPSDRYKKGEEVEAVVLGIDEQNKRISLGIKQLQTNPWDMVEQEYPVGRIVDGEVTKITNFGAFVKLPTGIEGLVRLSELSADEQVDKVEDFLKVGQKYQFRVIKLNQEEQRIALSLKLTDEAEPASAPARFTKRDSRSGGSAKRESRRQSHHDDYANNAPQSPKAKSALQLELEKHAARRDKRSFGDDNSDE